MALTYAQGVGDNSAPRETLRRLEMQLDQQREQMQIEMMIAERCPSLPMDLRQGFQYLSPALKCTTARLKNDSAATQLCMMSEWKADTFDGTQVKGEP
jgi:hypothetical protein